MLKAGQPIPGDADLVLIPGSKSTRGDLAYLREQGWDIDLYAHRRRGGHILGVCGGYQMLGKRIADPDGLEGPAGETEGLGLLDVSTEMSADKTLREVTAVHAGTGLSVAGYEIHLSQTREATVSARLALSASSQKGPVRRWPRSGQLSAWPVS